ncbi:malto-oligosyltrehalose trehalohydrolase [Shinella zoogloeoides]|uniref:malto-oligosyltrehalose trehalohydrolase n=1 Tax=Shinella zoogloeoides TaxID=352475 RepID=UPI00273FFA31|nr:malto-oligosyltrehalose trehalohydrolase [Shinella zoogloeoides]WLR95407.1 malto-oligosyltrehalose trehalohydrolase [Shinella zoogloeoides]
MMRACSWGPQFCEDGSTVFRLWAPAESTLALEIDGRRIAMKRQDDGWFAVRLENQPVGALYGFVLSDGRRVPDPASRFQPLGVDGPSLLCGPDCFAWRQADWCGRPWEEAVFYELHVGTFTRDGTYDAAIEHLPRLAEMGFTAIELMPIAQFPGRWGWGYDGVLQFAPHNAYGTPDDLKRLVDAAHQCGLMVFLDVVYNHFGPEGNFLAHYAPGFFHSEDPTPWGSRIAFDEPAVRSYFIGNVLHWLQEYRFDGLRLDAVDQIVDAGTPHILQEISDTVDATFTDRQVHLVVENPSNGGDLLVADETGHRLFAGDWNDEFHHAMHVAVTGEAEGHYAPYKDRPWKQVKQALAKGYLNQGKTTVGSALPNSACLPPTAFVHFLQNHDQVGNRALGDRLHTSLEPKVHRLLTEILFLSPQIPLVFMGDEHLSDRPFRFFADYSGDLAADIHRNRFKEAENFGGYPAGAGPEDIVDPNGWATFTKSKLDWANLDVPEQRDWRAFITRLIETRRRFVVPLLANARGCAGAIVSETDAELFVDWRLNGGLLQLRANTSEEPRTFGADLGDLVYASGPDGKRDVIAAWSTLLFVRPSGIFAHEAGS